MKTEDFSADIKPKAITAKRPAKKKPKDKPKRPLSAYNFFFKEEREKILKVVLAEDPAKVENDPQTEDYMSPEQLAKLRKEGGKVSFEEMGKLIGQRWKNIDPDRLSHFADLATEDTERYKKEMISYNGRQEAKMRSEAQKPPASAFVPKAGTGMMAQSGPGYGDMNSAAAYQNQQAANMGGYYGMGMDLTGYGTMPMGAMYGAYGGYGNLQGGLGQGMSGGNAEQMTRLGSQMQEAAMQQYGGSGMYNAMMNSGGSGFQGGMPMGYGSAQGQGGFDQSGSQQGMDPSQSQGGGGMYYGGNGQGWNQG